MQGGFWDAEGLKGIRTPVMFVAGSADDVSGYEKGTRAIYQGAVNADRYLLTFINANHNAAAPIPAPAETYATFRGRATPFTHYADPVWDTARMNNIFNHFATAFFGLHLKGEQDKQAYLDVVPNGKDAVYAVDREGKPTAAHTYWKGFKRGTAVGPDPRARAGAQSDVPRSLRARLRRQETAPTCRSARCFSRANSPTCCGPPSSPSASKLSRSIPATRSSRRSTSSAIRSHTASSRSSVGRLSSRSRIAPFAAAGIRSRSPRSPRWCSATTCSTSSPMARHADHARADRAGSASGCGTIPARRSPAESPMFIIGTTIYLSVTPRSIESEHRFHALIVVARRHLLRRPVWSAAAKLVRRRDRRPPVLVVRPLGLLGGSASEPRFRRAGSG